MSHSFKFWRRIARLRVPMLAALALVFGACSDGDAFNSETAGDPTLTDGPVLIDGSATDEADVVATNAVATGSQTVASASFAGGIPIGFFAQPVSEIGSRYNIDGNVLAGPSALRSELAAIKSRGGKALVNLSGSMKYYRNADNSFSLTKWKQRVDRYKGVDFDAYIKDGTVVGHFMIDEPNDPSNWGGRPVPASTVDAMGQYSKQRWPGLATIVRTEPKYFSSNPRYIDAAWAQYLARRGPVGDYIKRVVADAQGRGLALVVGMNVLKGGNPNGTTMSASEVQSYGSALLSSSYPCAFVSWKYNNSYLSSSSIKSAMDYLRNKAESHSQKSCRGG